MKDILTLKGVFILIIYLWSNTSFSQDSQAAHDWLEKIIAIEEDTINQLDTKINKLAYLQSSYKENYGERDSIYARIVHRLGAFLSEKMDYDKAISFTKTAIEINAAKLPTSQKSFLAHSYYNLGVFYNHLNIFEVSNQYLDSCISIGQQYSDKNRIKIKAIEMKAFSYFTTGDYQRSIEIADYGLLGLNDLIGSEYEAMLHVQKAQAQLALIQFNEAEASIQKAIRILSQFDVPSQYLASSYSVLANLLKVQGDYDESIYYYTKAYKINFQENNISQCIRDLSDLGFLYDENLTNPTKALECYTKSISLMKYAKDLYQLAVVYNNIGELYRGQKEYSKALHYFQKGLVVLPIGFNDTSLYNNPTISNFKLVTNDHIVSALLANKGESILGLYRKELNNDLLPAALDAFSAADRAVDQMRWKQNTQQSKLFWREKTKRMYEQAIETCFLLDNSEKAFFFFEKSRAALLNDKLSELGAKNSLSKSDMVQERDFRIKIFSLQGKLSSLPENESRYNQTKNDLFQARENQEMFIKEMERKYPAYYQYKYDTVNATIKEVREKILKEDQSLIEYFHGDSAIYMLAIMPDSTIFIKSNYKDYNNSANELLTLTSDKVLLNHSYNRYRQLAYEIYEYFFKPLSVHTKKVIISPDDHFVPFEILLTDPDNPSSFLLRDHAFSYTYSADYLIKHEEEQPMPANAFLGVAPVNYHPSLQQQPLTGADLSLKNIQSDFQSKKLLINESASKREFLDNLPFYTILHLYSHARADSIGTEPILYLQDSLIHVSELSTLGSLSTRLIILAACNTGIGKNIKGEGVFSLARGFAAAGVPSSITTLWPIDTQPTYQLSEILLKYISQGLPIDEALQKAKLDFLDNNDITYELPFFWAATILIGKTDQISQPNNRSSFLYLMAGYILFILIISALLYYYRGNYWKGLREIYFT
ncbi:CHAT domain-containing protein [Lunatibacter salilacus]|uniref:CHAT domain-containing protein n=1 Tax=Lunatibacter salilacus TaxID=2483804 RepID=UPI00131C30ED|nr:CHAT domain-containing protein [Lunatibacter salilacus]